MGPYEDKNEFKKNFKAPSGDSDSPFPVDVGQKRNLAQILLGSGDWLRNYNKEKTSSSDPDDSDNRGKNSGKGPGKMKTN